MESRAIVNLNLKSEKRGKSRRPPPSRPSPNYRYYAHRTATLAPPSAEDRLRPPASRALPHLRSGEVVACLPGAAAFRTRGSSHCRWTRPRGPARREGDPPDSTPLDVRSTRLRSPGLRALRSPALTSLRETSERVCNVYSNSLTKKQYAGTHKENINKLWVSLWLCCALKPRRGEHPPNRTMYSVHEYYCGDPKFAAKGRMAMAHGASGVGGNPLFR